MLDGNVAIDTKIFENIFVLCERTFLGFKDKLLLLLLY